MCPPQSRTFRGHLICGCCWQIHIHGFSYTGQEVTNEWDQSKQPPRLNFGSYIKIFIRVHSTTFSSRDSSWRQQQSSCGYITSGKENHRIKYNVNGWKGSAIIWTSKSANLQIYSAVFTKYAQEDVLFMSSIHFIIIISLWIIWRKSSLCRRILFLRIKCIFKSL